MDIGIPDLFGICVINVKNKHFMNFYCDVIDEWPYTFAVLPNLFYT